jgi:hypothetical protein
MGGTKRFSGVTVGTKSLLFGVHQVIWHPWTVLRAWRKLYGRPAWWEFVAIALHDVGYWGCPDMDGDIGQRHPVKGAHLSYRAVLYLSALGFTLKSPLRALLDESYRFEAFDRSLFLAASAHELAIGHSRFYAEKYGVQLSKLFKADKLSVLEDPKRFYLLRARLSSEVYEYISNARKKDKSLMTRSEWFDWYRAYILSKFGTTRQQIAAYVRGN